MFLGGQRGTQGSPRSPNGASGARLWGQVVQYEQAETDEQLGSGRSEGGGGKALLQEILFLLALKLDFRWNQEQKSNKETVKKEN